MPQSVRCRLGLLGECTFSLFILCCVCVGERGVMFCGCAQFDCNDHVDVLNLRVLCHCVMSYLNVPHSCQDRGWIIIFPSNNSDWKVMLGGTICE